MKNRVNQISFDTKPPRYVLILERLDGTWNVLEDDEKVLRAYLPKWDERASLHRAFTRQT